MKILAAAVRKVTRDITDFTIDPSRADQGELGLKWRILEKNDGAVIQLIYAGPTDAPIRIEGVIEGQRELAKVVYDARLKSEEQQYAEGKVNGNALFVACGIVFTVGWTLILAHLGYKWLRGQPINFGATMRTFAVPITLTVGILVILGIIFLLTRGGPPFDF